MRWSLKRIVIFVLAVYFAITCYTFYKLLQRRTGMLKDVNEESSRAKVDDDSWNPWGEDFEREGWHRPHAVPMELPFNPVEGEGDEAGEEPDDDLQVREGDHVVEIWGKAAIGNYLWEHIFRGTLQKKLGGIWSYGEKRQQNIIFRFRTGPGVVPAKVPQDVENLVIVLNGREDSKIEFSTVWLNYLTSSLPRLVNLAVVMLGNEMCLNSWVDSYLHKNGGLVKLLYQTYDSKEVDNVNVFQWPLGVATYRGFPVIKVKDIDVRTRRQYTCNFLGTIYSGSSRDVLIKVAHDHDLHKWCYINPRYDWLPGETQESREEYYHALLQSDFTLNPVGQNTECYRVYEAMSYGSIPIVENRMTPGNCGNNSIYENAPLRLLKQYNAPVIFIYDWKQLPQILEKYRNMSLEDIIKLRLKILNWYDRFKSQIRDQFVSSINNRFFESKDNQNR